MEIATTNTPQFDLSSAVPETDDGVAVSAMPTFDLKSAMSEESIEAARPQDNLPEEQAAPLRKAAYEKMQSGIEQIPPSPISEAVRGFIKNVGKGGLEQLKESEFDYKNSANYPIQKEGESDQDFDKRLQEFKQPLEDQEIAKGAMGQLSDTFNAALLLAAPEMSPKAWATLGAFMVKDQTRQAVQNIFAPNMTPSEKDVLDLVSFPIEGGMAHSEVKALGDMISKAFTIKGLTPTIDLQPDFLKLWAEPQVTERPAPFVKSSQEGWPAADIQTPTGTMSGGVLEKLGITQDHYDVSQNTDLPVRIPLVNLFNLTSDEAKQASTFEGEDSAIKSETKINLTPRSEGGIKDITDQNGKILGNIGWDSADNPNVGSDFNIEVNAGERDQDVATKAIQKAFDSGLISITGDLGGDKPIGFWEKIGATVKNGKIYLSKENFIKSTGEENASQGRESTEGRSIEEGTNGEAQVGVHLRDASQGGMETQAGEEINVPRETSGERVTSKIAKSIEQKAVDAKLTDKFDTLAGEEKVNVAEQSKLATNLVNDDLENARSIVRGDKPLPGKLRGTALITAMEEHLKENPDADIAHELANSPLVSATTRAAQELRLAAEREPDSFTAKMAELKRSLIDNAGGEEKISQDRGKMVEQMKKETSKINLSKDELKWEKFLDDIQC